MRNRSLATALMLMVFMVGGTVRAQMTPSLTEIKEDPISLQVNQERLITMSVSRVTTGNANIVKVTPLSDNTGVLLTGLNSGKTDVRLFPLDEPGVVRVFEVTVKRRDVSDLKAEVDALLRYMIGVQVEQAGENLVLKGDVLEPEDRLRLNKIIELYPELTDFTVNKYQQVEEERLRDMILTDLEDEKLTTIRVEIKNVRGEFKALLRGVAYTDRARARAEEIAKLYYEEVVNLVQLEKPVIEIDVVITELDLIKVKQLGTNDVWAQATSFALTGYLDSNFGRSSFFDNTDDNVGESAGEQRPDEPGVSIAPTFSLAPEGVTSFIRALKSADATVFYSEQHQAVLSGETASFKDGGTILFEVSTGLATSVEEIEFGLEVEVTPEQKEDGTIVNKIDVSNSTIGGLTPSGDQVIDSFETASVVECRSDETIVLSGVDTNQLVHSDSGTPYLRRIPIVNLFFRARDKTGTETRSMILITPTSSTIKREGRAAFSVDSFRQRDFIQKETPYWERDIDWGYYDEFYEKPTHPIWFISSYKTTLYYDDTTGSFGVGMRDDSIIESSSDEGMYTDDSMATDEGMPEDGMSSEEMATEEPMDGGM